MMYFKITRTYLKQLPKLLRLKYLSYSTLLSCIQTLHIWSCIMAYLEYALSSCGAYETTHYHGLLNNGTTTWLSAKNYFGPYYSQCFKRSPSALLRSKLNLWLWRVKANFCKNYLNLWKMFLELTNIWVWLQLLMALLWTLEIFEIWNFFLCTFEWKCHVHVTALQFGSWSWSIFVCECVYVHIYLYISM